MAARPFAMLLMVHPAALVLPATKALIPVGVFVFSLRRHLHKHNRRKGVDESSPSW